MKIVLFFFIFLNFNIFAIDKVNSSNTAKFCKKLNRKFYKLGWQQTLCFSKNWNNFGLSVKGDPLLYKIYPLKNDKKIEHITLIFCGVHGDEITPFKFCFDIVKDLDSLINKKTGKWKNTNYFGSRVVIAPIVNPDSFLKKYPTRTNANKIDINRNFPTNDFKKMAIKMWKTKYRSTKRKYPGQIAASEPETKFQIFLIKKFHPTKILSVHAPLTMIDYDGPDSFSSGGMIGRSANQLLISMSEEAKGYRIMNYPFFPGSLGNYAGNERGIPTYTLELPSSDNRNSKKYWKLFRDSIRAAVYTKFNEQAQIALKKTSR